MMWICVFGFVCLISQAVSQNAGIQTLERTRDTFTIWANEENSAQQIFYDNRVKREGSTKIVPERKTGVTIDQHPAKPDFEYVLKSFGEGIGDQPHMEAIITWLPCGKENNCKGRIAGTKFFTKYRLKNATQFTMKTYPVSKNIRRFQVLVGKTYEVVVSSINGDLETESDPREIYITPATSPVQEVKVLPLGTGKFLLAWRAPRNFSSPITKYRVVLDRHIQGYRLDNQRDTYVDVDGSLDQLQAKVGFIRDEGNYRASIIPYTESGLGTTYEIELKLQNKSSLPLAKPELTYKFLKKDGSPLPSIRIRWFPCGKSHDCKNSRPGSDFIVKYKRENDAAYNIVPETWNDYVDLEDAVPNNDYKFIVTSFDYLDSSRPMMDSDEVIIHVPSSDPPITLVETLSGQEFVLPCNVTRSSKPDIQWFLNGNPIKHMEYLLNEKVEMENGDLKLQFSASPFLTLHLHQLECSDQSQTNVNATTWVLLKSKTVITNEHNFGERQRSVGETIKLMCEVRKDISTAVDVKWLRDGKDQGGEMVVDLYTKVLMKKHLTIDLKSDEQFGNYTCVAKSRWNEDRATVSLVQNSKGR